MLTADCRLLTGDWTSDLGPSALRPVSWTGSVRARPRHTTTPLAVNTAPFQPLADEHVVHNDTEEARLVLIVDL